jgi:hypothetical protein
MVRTPSATDLAGFSVIDHPYPSAVSQNARILINGAGVDNRILSPAAPSAAFGGLRIIF